MVIDRGFLRAQHEVLDPVGRRPAGRSPRAQADAPRRLAVLDHLFRQRLEVFHRFRNLVAEILEVLGDVPDQRLHVGIEEEAVKVVFAVLVLVGAEIDPAVAGGVVGSDEFARVVVKRSQEAALRHVGREAGLRKDGDVGGRTGLGVDDDLLFHRVGTDIGHAGTGRLFEERQKVLEVFLLPREPRAENRDFRTGVVMFGGKGIEPFPVVRAFALGEHAIFALAVGKSCGQGQRCNARNQGFFHEFLPVLRLFGAS